MAIGDGASPKSPQMLGDGRHREPAEVEDSIDVGVVVPAGSLVESRDVQGSAGIGGTGSSEPRKHPVEHARRTTRP